MKRILAALLAALLIVQAGMFTAFADNPVEKDAITIYIGMEDSHPVLLVEFSQDLLDKINKGDGTWDSERLVVSGDDIQLKDGKYSFELKLSAKEGFVFDNDLSTSYQGIDGNYKLHYDFPLDQEGQPDYHTMIVSGEFDNIISESPLINVGNIKSDDIARMIALVISGDYEGAVDFLLEDGVPFSKKAHIDTDESSSSVRDDTYSYQLVLKTNEGFTFTNALSFIYKEEVFGYKLEYKYNLANNGHTLFITGTGSGTPQNSLINEIEDAKKISNSDGKYTPESFKALQDAIAKAEAVITDKNSKIRDLINAYDAIAVAKAGLVENSSGSNPADPTPVNPQPDPDVSPTTPVQVEIVDLPAVKISKPKAAKKKVTVKWKKISKKNQKKISKIQIQVAKDRGFTKIVKTTTASKKKTAKTIKGLKSKTRYYVRIRAYAAGNHVSAWKWKSVKVK